MQEKNKGKVNSPGPGPNLLLAFHFVCFLTRSTLCAEKLYENANSVTGSDLITFENALGRAAAAVHDEGAQGHFVAGNGAPNFKTSAASKVQSHFVVSFVYSS